MPIEDFIIIVYCCVTESYAELVTSRGFATKLSDAEVITMEIVGDKWGKIQTKAYGDIFAPTGMTGFLTWVHGQTLLNKARTYGR